MLDGVRRRPADRSMQVPDLSGPRYCM